MDFRRSIGRRSSIKPSFTLLHEKYPNEMQLYHEYPDFDVTVKEFEEFTCHRLSVLQTIDEINAKGLKGDEWRRAIFDELKKDPDMKSFCKLISATSLGSDEANYVVRRMDHVSHFVLRLAFCDTEEKRRWFISRELDLFRLRWMYLSSASKKQFLLINSINYDVASDEEKVKFAPQSNGFIVTSLDYFKVPFYTISDLVRGRKVFIANGLGFITNDDVIAVLVTSLRSHLSQSMATASRRIHLLDEDDRIASILKGAGKTQREINYSMSEHKDKVNIQNLDALSELSYPLCMQQLHKRLRAEHHLKNSGRLQYGLFLKGIGVTVEDALKFWKLEFTKKMEPDKFEKEYAYNIRHINGQEGKRANYTPQSCMKIINSSAGPGEFHGCPFKSRDAVAIKKTLTDNGLSALGVSEVVDLAKKGHYQLACGKYFQLKHNTDEPPAINHPNYYYDESQKIILGKHVKQEFKTPKPSGTPTPIAKSESKSPASGWEESIDFSEIDV